MKFISRVTVFLITITSSVAMMTGCGKPEPKTPTKVPTVNYSQEPGGSLKPPPGSHKSTVILYFVPLGSVPPDLVKKLADYYTERLGIKTDTLGSLEIPDSAHDPDRHQVVVEDLIMLLKSGYPKIAPRYVIGITDQDMYSKEVNYRFTFSSRDSNPDAGYGVVSYARMDPKMDGGPADDGFLWSRIRKMTSKNVCMIYYGLNQSDNPQSVLFSPILSLDDLDREGQGF